MYLLASEVHVQFVYSFNTRLYCFNKLHHFNAMQRASPVRSLRQLRLWHQHRPLQAAEADGCMWLTIVSEPIRFPILLHSLEAEQSSKRPVTIRLQS